MSTERLQKILAAAGYGSRRACEEIVSAGRVRVNGKTAQLGDKADPQVDSITLDGDVVSSEKLVYVVLHKPRGVVSSAETQDDRKTVNDLVEITQRVYPVGRLDALSEGLILLTNDGELTNRLTHPRYGHEKEYRVLVLGELDQEALHAWRRGIVIEDEDGHRERTAPAKVEVQEKQGEGTWLRVIMHEGKKHQIRRVAQTLGLHVARLIRVRLGTIQLGNLKPGEWRPLSESELRILLAEIGAPVKFKNPKAAVHSAKTAPGSRSSARPQTKDRGSRPTSKYKRHP